MKCVYAIGVKDLFSTILSIIFVAHVSYIVYEILYPEYPEIVNYKRDLQDIEFPITFKICANKDNLSIVDKKYEMYGYEDLWQFYNGQSMYNASTIGWAGHTKDGTTIAPVAGGNNMKLYKPFRFFRNFE